MPNYLLWYCWDCNTVHAEEANDFAAWLLTTEKVEYSTCTLSEIPDVSTNIMVKHGMSFEASSASINDLAWFITEQVERGVPFHFSIG